MPIAELVLARCSYVLRRVFSIAIHATNNQLLQEISGRAKGQGLFLMLLYLWCAQTSELGASFGIVGLYTPFVNLLRSMYDKFIDALQVGSFILLRVMSIHTARN